MLRSVVALAVVGLALVLPTSASAQGYKVLVATSTEDELSAAGIAAIQAVASSGGFTVTAPSPAAVGGEFTPANLEQYRAVVFLNTTGDVLNAAQQAAFEEYYRDGGGFVGIHSAIETEPDWPFLTDVLGTRATGRTAVSRRRSRSPTGSTPRPRTCRSTGTAHGRLVQLRLQRARLSHVLATVDESRRSRLVRDPAWGAARGHQRRHDGLRPPDHLVQGLPGRPLVLHRPRRHAGQLRRDRPAQPPRRRDPVGGGQSDRTATAARRCWPTTRDFVAAPPNVSEPIGFDVLPDGRVIQTDRRGGVRLHDPATNTTTCWPRSRSTRPARTACTARRSTTTSPPTSGCTCTTRR